MSLDDVTSFPLHWPALQPRTPAEDRKRWRGETWGKPVPLGASMEGVLEELGRMGIRREAVVLSMDRPRRLDGLPKASAREPDDPGVAVWFVFDGYSRVLACDLWKTNAQNLRAICRTIEALRGLERWGACDLAQAFEGHRALPPSGAVAPDPDPWDFFGLERDASSEEDVRRAFRDEAKLVHPDQPDGDQAAFERAVRMRDRALADLLGGTA